MPDNLLLYHFANVLSLKIRKLLKVSGKFLSETIEICGILIVSVFLWSNYEECGMENIRLSMERREEI